MEARGFVQSGESRKREVLIKTQNRRRKLASLNEIGQLLTTITDVDEVLERILELTMDVFELESCAVLLWDKETGELRFGKARGYDPEIVNGFCTKGEEGITGWVLTHGSPCKVDDVSKDPRYIRGVQGACSEMAAPLKRGDEVIGVLDAEILRADAFTEEDLEMFSIFASQAAASLHNAQVYQQLQQRSRSLERRVKELKFLHEVSGHISLVIDLDELLDEILHQAYEAFRFKACAILLVEPEARRLRLRAAFGYPESTKGAVFDLNEGISGWVARKGEPVLVPDVSKDQRYLPGVEGGRCEMAVPLRSRGKVIGVLDAETCKRGAYQVSDLELFSIFASQAAIAIDNARLFEKTHQAYYETIRALAQALEARDPYTRGHSERVTTYSLRIALRLHLPESDLVLIQQAGMLHDIGKIGISDTILHKEKGLTAEDRSILRSHPSFGDKILSSVKFLDKALQIILHHHERFDGKGYPNRIQGEDIPLIARVIAVADAYDAMTSDRPYRHALPHRRAVHEIMRNAGTQFDPQVVRAFLQEFASAEDLQSYGSLEEMPPPPGKPLADGKERASGEKALVDD